MNLYRFLENDSVNRLDVLGLRDRIPFPKDCWAIDDIKNLGEALDSLRRDLMNWRKGGFGEPYRQARKDSCNGLHNFLNLLEKCCGPWSEQQERYMKLVRNVANTWCSDSPSSFETLEREVKETIKEFGVQMEAEPDNPPISILTISGTEMMNSGVFLLPIPIFAPPTAPVIIREAPALGVP